MSVFDFTDYKSFLKASFKKLNRRGVITELAKSIGCSHSYLSQVMSGKPELTPDQALLATDYLQLSTEESKYFLLLALKSRAATQKLKKHYDDQLKLIKSENLQLKTVVSKSAGDEISNQDKDFYYSNWTPTLIHILTACPDYQTANAIAARTKLSVKEINTHLDWLIQRGFLNKKDNKYTYVGKNIHLPTESIHNRINHLNWRQKAQDNFDNSTAIRYTSVFAISTNDIDKLRTNLLSFIEKQREEVSQSGSDEVLVFCCDLFQP